MTWTFSPRERATAVRHARPLPESWTPPAPSLSDALFHAERIRLAHPIPKHTPKKRPAPSLPQLVKHIRQTVKRVKRTG